MNSRKPNLDKLFAMARSDEPGRGFEAPPMFCCRVVRRWLSATTDGNGGASWNRSIRYGLAFASVAMVVSIALNFHVWRQADSLEQLAAEAVVWLALPK
jgi:sugar phosphate permease